MEHLEKTVQQEKLNKLKKIIPSSSSSLDPPPFIATSAKNSESQDFDLPNLGGNPWANISNKNKS